MEIQVKIFGFLYNPDVLNGARKGYLEVTSGITVADLFDILALKKGSNLIVLVNDNQESLHYQLMENDCVKILMPISGG